MNGKKIGIYKELAVAILFSIVAAAATAIGIYFVCSNYGILVEVEEDYSQYRKKCDLQVMQMVRELDSALNTAMEEIAGSDSGEGSISDAMRYLLRNNKMPFTSIEEGQNMTITLVSRKGTVLWKNDTDEAEFADRRTSVNVEELVAKSYDEESDEYIFVYTKSIDKILYYIIFQTYLSPEYNYNYLKLKAACIMFAAVLFLIMVLLLCKSRISYIRYLSEVVDEISKGNLNTEIKKKGYDELTVIADSIDEMQHNLDRMMKEERENERKSRELITNLSHDIKTPMTIITGYLDVVISGKYSDDAQRQLYTRKAFQQVEKINGMIHKIFVLSKNETKVEKTDIVKCNLSLMLCQDVSEFQAIAQKENRKINTNIPEKPLYANIVIEDMCEALDNILMNAVKYSKPESEITVAMTEEENTIHITVSNEAEEMKDQDCERIFEKFYRADHARSSSIPGNGLGLSIVRETVEGYGGKVWAEYAQGIYAIHIRLPKA